MTEVVPGPREGVPRAEGTRQNRPLAKGRVPEPGVSTSTHPPEDEKCHRKSDVTTRRRVIDCLLVFGRRDFDVWCQCHQGRVLRAQQTHLKDPGRSGPTRESAQYEGSDHPITDLLERPEGVGKTCVVW